MTWSGPEPTKNLAIQFKISDVALKKTCARADIPTPDRGYWAKKQAGKQVFQRQLPIRPPGMDDEVLIAAGNSYWYQSWDEKDLLGPLPPFSHTLDRFCPDFFVQLIAIPEFVHRYALRHSSDEAWIRG